MTLLLLCLLSACIVGALPFGLATLAWSLRIVVRARGPKRLLACASMVASVAVIAVFVAMWLRKG